MSDSTAQVPRDAAFWNTHRAVQAEQDAMVARAGCRDRGHEIVWRADEPPVCGTCGMSRDDAMWDDGWAKLGDQWVWVGPLNLVDLSQRYTTIRTVTAPDGSPVRVEATLVHAPTGARVDIAHAGSWDDVKTAAYRQLMVEIAKLRRPDTEETQ